MERTLQEAFEWEGEITESVQQQPPPPKLPSNEEKSLHEILYAIYVEECGKEADAEVLESNVYLLKKLLKREALPCLIVSLYPENQGYSLMIKDKCGSFSEPFQLPYEAEELIEYLDAEELPPFLIDVLEKSPVNVFHHGCVIAEIRDYRQGSNIDPAGELAAEPAVLPAVSPPAYQSRHILLHPTMQSLVSDVHSIPSDNHQWTEEEKLEPESQLISASAEPLYLFPSDAVNCTADNLLFNEMNTDPMKQCSKRHAYPSLDQQEVPFVCTCPPDLATATPLKKQAKVRVDDPYDLKIAGAETWKQRPCELPLPPEMGMLFGDEGPSVLATPEVKYDSMFDYENGDQLWETSPNFMKSLNEPLFSAEIGLLPEDRTFLDDYSDDFMAGVNTGPGDTEDVCQGSVQSEARCPDKMPQESGSPLCPQPSLGTESTTSLLPFSILEKESRPPPPVTLVPISRQGSSTISWGPDTPHAPKASIVVQQTLVREDRVSTLPAAVQPNARSSENNPKVQPSTRTTAVNVNDVLKSVSQPGLVSNSSQVLGCPTGVPATKAITQNSLILTREPLPGPGQHPMQLIINNTTSPLTVKLPPGSIILRPEPQNSSQEQLQQPQQIYVLIPKRQQPPRAPVPRQPVPPACSQGSNHQHLSLPALQASHLNIEQTTRPNIGRAGVFQQTQTFVMCQIGATPQNHRQNVHSANFQLSAVIEHQRPTQTQNMH
ncbi:transcription factor SPT20 homolog [Acomys russatus]|uniref:transcription factor SPT20 homolog n=1 Tax=Acomys russatus TaxID=60746 RepID=UPI0021E31D74|nr:transcription factor SPT20 homolog [Acomys russatus]